MLPAVSLARQKQPQSPLPRLIWTDLVFRVPPRKPLVEVAAMESGRYGGSLQAMPTGHLKGCRGRMDPKNNKKIRPCHLRLDCIQEKEAEERSECPPPSVHLGNPLSTPRTPATREKCVVRKISVDLRPILEKVMAASDSGQEERAERQPQPDGCPPSKAGDFGPEDLIEGGEDLLTEVTTTCFEEGGTHPVVSLPPIADPFKAGCFAAKDSSAPTVFPAQAGAAPQLWDNNSQGSPAPEPGFRKTLSLPRIIPQQQEDWLDTISSGKPRDAPSPDFELPTQLLLQRLQETTTSKNHMLIMEVLSSLREELMVDTPHPDARDERSHLPELPRSNPWKNTKSNPRPAATKRRKGKLIWYINRSTCT